MAGYGDDAGLTAWLAGMGYTLPVGAPTAAVLRQRGSAYLDAIYGGLWEGRPTAGVLQERQWPRTGAKVDCIHAVPDDAIPVAVVNASYRAAWLEASNPGSLSASMTMGQRVAREKVDVIEVAYHNDNVTGAGMGATAYLDSEIDGAMRQFICDKTVPIGFWAIGSDCDG